MKKILSILITVAMLATLVPSYVIAEMVTFDVLETMAGTSQLELPENWKKADTAYASHSKIIPIESGRTGDISVYIKGQTAGGDNARVDLVYTGTIPAGTYTLELWAKQNANCFGSWRMAVFGDQGNNNHTVGETDADGWTKITKTVTVAEDITNQPIIGLVGNSGSTRAIVVDDISLKNQSGVNVLTDGGFENIGGGDTSDRPDRGPDTIKILACSDFQHNDGSEAGAEIVSNIIDSIKDDGFESADAFFACGDYAKTMGETEENLQILKDAVIDFVPEEDNHVYVQGNHDAEIGTQGLALSGNNDPDSGEYAVYVINEDDYMWYNSDLDRIKDTAKKLAYYLDEKLEDGYTKPIFVLSHLPLYKSLRTAYEGDAKHANQIFHVLNQAGAQGLNVIFMYGHDHSSGYDSYLGGGSVYLAKGDSINIAQGNGVEFKAETLNFTYMNAGYVGYYSSGSGRDSALTMTMFEIDGDEVDIYRYDQSGLHNLKSKGVLKTDEISSGEYEADTKVYTSPQTVTTDEVEFTDYIYTLDFIPYSEGFEDVQNWHSYEEKSPWDDIADSSIKDVRDNAVLKVNSENSINFNLDKLGVTNPGKYEISMKLKPENSGSLQGNLVKIVLEDSTIGDKEILDINYGDEKSIELLDEEWLSTQDYDALISELFELNIVWDSENGTITAKISGCNKEFTADIASTNGDIKFGKLNIHAGGDNLLIDDISVKNLNDVAKTIVTFEELEEMALTSDLRLPSQWGKSDVANAASSKIVPVNVGRTGDYSVYIKGQTAGDYNARVDLVYKGTIPAGTYTLSFWAKQNENCFGSWRFAVCGDQNNQNHIVGETDDAGWTKIVKTVTFAADVTNQPIIGLVGSAGSTRAVVVDDISLNDENGVNILPEGGFENVGSGEEPEEPDAPLTFEEVEEMAQTNGLALPSAWVKSDTAYAGSSKVIPVAYGRTGEYSVYIKGQTVGSDNARVDLVYIGTIPAGTYTLELWAMQNANCFGSWRMAVFGDQGNNNHIVGETDIDGWTKITKTVTIVDDVVNQPIIGLVGNSGSSRAIVVDDISLTNQDGVNFIVDGGFESGNEEEPDEPDNPDIPVEPDIPEEPEETEVTFEVLKEKADVSKNAHSLYWNKGTTGYEAKTKVVPIEYGRSGTYSMYVGGTHGDGTELSLIYKGIIPTGTYILEFWTIAAPYTLGSWRFGGFNNFNNGNHTVGEVDADGWTKITRVVTLEEDTTDPGIIQIKNDGTLRAVVVDDIRLLDENGNDTGIIEDGGFELSTGASGTSGISFGEAKTLADFASYSDKSIWSMSVEGETVNAKMVPINASHKGKTSMYIGGTGTNGSAVYMEYAKEIPAGTYTLEFWTITSPDLLGSSKFATLANFSGGKLSGTGTVEAGWTKVTKEITFSETVSGAKLFGIKLEGGVTGAIIDDIKLCLMDGSDTGIIEDGGFESIIPDYTISQAGLYTIGGRKVSAPSAPGGYKIKVPVANNRVEEGLKYQQVVALYKGDALVNVYSTIKTINVEDGTVDVTTDNIVVPDEGEYSIVVYTMDSILTRNLYHTPNKF